MAIDFERIGKEDIIPYLLEGKNPCIFLSACLNAMLAPFMFYSGLPTKRVSAVFVSAGGVALYRPHAEHFTDDLFSAVGYC